MIKLGNIIKEIKKDTKKIVIVHGWSGSPKNDWIPNVTSELKNLGHNVQCLTMPHPHNPTIQSWISYLSKNVNQPNENTFFIGHSIGCQAIMRYLETLNIKVGGIFLVAGFFDLNNLDNKEKEIAKPWIETPIDFEKVKNNTNFSIVFLSENDPDVPYEKNKEKFKNSLNSTIFTFKQAGHFTSSDGYETFPQLVSIVSKKLSLC